MLYLVGATGKLGRGGRKNLSMDCLSLNKDVLILSEVRLSGKNIFLVKEIKGDLLPIHQRGLSSEDHLAKV